MGKVKRKRSKYHLSANGSKANDIGSSHTSTEEQMDQISTPVLPADGLFNLVNIDLANINTQLNPVDDNDDTKSFISKKSIGMGQHLKKKEKMKMRHEKWLEKIQTVKMNKKKKSEAKKRASTAIVGDLRPLTDALPELSEILRTTKKTNVEKHAERLNKKSSTWKSRDRQKLVINEVDKYKQVLSHSAFKLNALATINQHLKNTIQMEKDMMEDD